MSSKPTIAIVDYGMGNLRSVAKALEKVGAHVIVTDSPAKIRSAQGVVLPGVGAFGEASRRLRSTGLDKAIHDVLKQKKPFLGICLGLQLLFERSAENPKDKGLGYWKGSVKRFKLLAKSKLKVPHMGWNTLRLSRKQRAGGRKNLLQGISEKSYFYFVHSYYPVPKNRTIIASETDYGGTFCSSASEENVFACQFHPEKSGAPGQRLLRNFVKEVSLC